MKDYGKAKTYTPKQVKRSIERSGLSTVYACFGMAIFSGRDDFDKYHQEIGENCDYDVMRCELAGNYFNGNSNFSGADVTSLSSDFASGFDSDGYAGGDGGKVTKHLYEY
jgi:hypothetical protein